MVFLLLSVSASSYAWDAVTNGKINIIEMEKGGPYSFRIWLKDAPPLCGNANKWAYLDYQSPNYDALVSALMSAKFADADVKIYANVSQQNYCEIGHIQVW